MLVVKPEGMIPPGKPRCREVNIKIDPEERGCKDMKCIHIVRDRNQLRAMVNMVMKI
jgi:hypothetical protein